MHPRNRQLQAFIDHELPAAEASDVLAHVATCDRCAARVTHLRSLAVSFHGAILDIDAAEPLAWAGGEAREWTASAALDSVPEPAIALPAVTRPLNPGRAAVREHPQQTHPADQVRERWRPAPYRAPLRWAAIFVFGSTAMGAAALLVQRAFRPQPPIVPTADRTSMTPATDATASGAQEIAGAIVVQPANGEVVVTIGGAGTGSRLFVEFIEESGIRVQVEGDVTPRFRARDGNVEVSLDGVRAQVRVLLPPALRSAVIASGERVLVRVREGRLEPPQAAAGLLIR
jgi:anti-sigma factor RsiW